MSKDRKTITKGRDAIKSTNDTIAVWKMGNRLYGTDQTLGKDGFALHHHRDGVPDMMGGRATGQRLHGCYDCEFFVWKCVDPIWLSENLNEWLRNTFPEWNHQCTHRRVPGLSSGKYTVSPTSQWDGRNIQQNTGDCTDQSVQHVAKRLEPACTCSVMVLQDNMQETDGTNTFLISLWCGSCHVNGIYHT